MLTSEIRKVEKKWKLEALLVRSSFLPIPSGTIPHLLAAQCILIHECNPYIFTSKTVPKYCEYNQNDAVIGRSKSNVKQKTSKFGLNNCSVHVALLLVW